ncbi:MULTISPECIES: reverse transcriptase family protein [unclassified Snodgrassella]|uniref:reverse transcriptase family protein n=1 Tax=unclassified Snodgrassella TaxID=2625236 RepID=UPI0018DE2F0F|nr:MULTISPECIES: reverse transcriptase family protein [unclassified Snodgrassella]MBI0067858.1 RNA-directed DNA polymerase [Snodgrassella sp. M0110]MBI0076857.1 RNA-directed DNA polymerase [Snodgrassella sp. M0118]MBI0079158.1 RNA-directed DNA polymerase [Snodgrassella sp. M0112]
MIKPQLFYYPLAGIQSIESLAKHLDIDLDKLTYLLENINSQYIGPIFIKKSNGGSRPIYRCRPQLKYFLKRLNSKVFKLVHYPNFLYGALPNKSIYTNASQHLNAKVMCNFDIKSYFTTITFDHVFDIFKNFFHFSTEVSNILATLTTINNQVPQGSPCSTYIANLVFYRSEVNVANKLKDKNYVYTRFIDDITVSSQYKKTKKDIEEVHTIVIGMIRAYKFSLQTEKRSIAPSHKCQILTVNQINIVKSNLSISKENRKKIRAAVHELKCNLNDNNIEFVVKNFESVYGRVQYLKNIHIKEAQGMLKQLEQIRSKILKPLQIYKYRKLKEAIRKKQGYKL